MLSDQPLVSCIMPTRGRPQFAAAAVGYWRDQTYQNRELVIVDDADSPSFSVAPSADGVSYHRLPTRLSLGAKRNVACSRSAGELICHWDDDDYSAPGRIADQVARLLATGKQITGYFEMEFHEGERRWVYRAASDEYALGTSLMYRREFWQRNVFQVHVNTGEDTYLITAGRRAKGVICSPAGDLMWASVHPGNTSKRQLTSKAYRELPPCA